MGRITFPKFPPTDPNRPSIPKGIILPIHTPICLPGKMDRAALNTPMVSWNPGIPVPSHDVTHEEIDLFRAKSITLVRNSQLNCPVEKWIQSIQTTPIMRVVKIEGDQKENAEEIVTLQQLLPIDQGVLVEVSFRRKGTHRLLSVPLQESFHLSKHPCKAHPLPHQHTGWALGEELFTPPDGLAAEKLHFITHLAQNSLLAEQTKQLLSQKQSAFHQMPKRLLERHRLLAHALESASQVPSPPGVIDTYFASLDEKEGWSHLTHLYEAVNSILQKKLYIAPVTPPSTALIPSLHIASSASSVLAASALLQAQSRHPAERYTRWIVQLLRQGAENPDTRFGKQLQEIYTLQLERFLKQQREAMIQAPGEIAEQMVETLEKEIAILTQDF